MVQNSHIRPDGVNVPKLPQCHFHTKYSKQIRMQQHNQCIHTHRHGRAATRDILHSYKTQYKLTLSLGADQAG